MNDIPVGAMVGKVRILSTEEALDEIGRAEYTNSEKDNFPPEVHEMTQDMMTSFVKSYNLVCGMDEIGQLLLYWHGNPSTLIYEYFTKNRPR